jgi:hypothetical protein
MGGGGTYPYVMIIWNELPTAVQYGAESLKGSHRVGDGWIFLKNQSLLNEPNFGRIHLD